MIEDDDEASRIFDEMYANASPEARAKVDELIQRLQGVVTSAVDAEDIGRQCARILFADMTKKKDDIAGN